MVTVGIDTHERSRMVVVVDKHARELAWITIGTTLARPLAAARLGSSDRGE